MVGGEGWLVEEVGQYRRRRLLVGGAVSGTISSSVCARSPSIWHYYLQGSGCILLRYNNTWLATCKQ
jgi:hypothetical protein